MRHTSIHHSRSWRLLIALLMSFTLIPLCVLVLSLRDIDASLWQHLLDFSLPQLISNTLYLLIGVGALSLLIATPLAWLVTQYQFPARYFFNWALALPLAVPAYVMAFSQQGLFEFSGPLQTWWRTHHDAMRNTSLFESVPLTLVVISTLSLAFYPYVYLLARQAFRSMGQQAIETGQSLGLSRSQSFTRIALPMARPWLAAGVMLVLMETLAEFGAVSIFNFDTLTSAIYKAWFALFSIETAQQLALLLVLFVLVIYSAEQYARRRYVYAPRYSTTVRRTTLTGARAWLATLAASLVFLLAFALPFAQLLYWSINGFREAFTEEFIRALINSMSLAAQAALFITVMAFLLSYARRRDASSAAALMTHIAILGYAVPGTVLAIGVFVPVATLDGWLITWFQSSDNTHAILKGSLFVMLLTFLIRFLSVAYNTIDSGMKRISNHQEEAARSLGSNNKALLYRLYVPLLKKSSLTALLLVFIEVIKEMPITLMTRPFNKETLSVRIFNFTTEGQWEQAALPAIAIVLCAMIPLLILSHQADKD